MKLRKELEEFQRENGLGVRDKFAELKARMIQEIESIIYEDVVDGAGFSLGRKVELSLRECNK